MTSRVAFAAAHDDDVAAVRAAVGARRPVGHELARGARMPESGSPDAMPLAMTMMSGSTSQCWTANSSPGPPEAGLDLVGDEQDAVLAGDLAQPRQEARRRHDVAALAEDRLDDDRRDLLRVDELVERQVELGLPVAGAVRVGACGAAGGRGSSTDRPCGRRCPGSGSKCAAVDVLRGRQRHRLAGPAVVAVAEARGSPAGRSRPGRA